MGRRTSAAIIVLLSLASLAHSSHAQRRLPRGSVLANQWWLPSPISPPLPPTPSPVLAPLFDAPAPMPSPVGSFSPALSPVEEARVWPAVLSWSQSLNKGKKVGLIFAGIAGVMQVGVVVYLALTRRYLSKMKDRYETVS